MPCQNSKIVGIDASKEVKNPLDNVSITSSRYRNMVVVEISFMRNILYKIFITRANGSIKITFAENDKI